MTTETVQKVKFRGQESALGNLNNLQMVAKTKHSVDLKLRLRKFIRKWKIKIQLNWKMKSRCPRKQNNKTNGKQDRNEKNINVVGSNWSNRVLEREKREH